ncbi:MAG TPA: P63C domain-containing protein [Xanthobacteraceae bacterium]|nr:P63C domain-containing protein [Xanthobacteraceae bacterium]
MSDENPQSRGGRARAELLSPERKREIASRAAKARWGSIEPADSAHVPRAIAMGVLKIGSIPCAVLDDSENTRVLTQAGLLSAIGRFPNPKSAGNPALAHLPAFLRAKNLEPFISSELVRSSSPLIFDTAGRGGSGGRALGYKAQLLNDVCWVYAKAQMAGKLVSGQKHIAEACTVLLQALTNVAIDALVDEATGFQDIRAKDALIKLLEKYVSQDALPWVKTFDNDFYKEMFRVHGYPYDPASVKRPMIFAKRTEDIYDRLAPGVRQELQRVVKRGPSGRPSEKLFQHLTENEGYRQMIEHLAGIKAILKLSNDVKDFQRKLDKVFPRFGDTLQIPFPEED